ncbi:MAG TPA: OsmC family protein [Verrucomicrobiae bacterium]|nr:OsmC family protein [Verrucomicrobiae bacterium]
MEKQYVYRVTAASTSFLSGFTTAEEIQPLITFSAPPEFQGEAGRWTPEHLFLASVAGCFVSTFSGMAQFSKFEFLLLDLEVEGVLSKEEEGWRFTQVSLQPRLKIAQEKDLDRANRLLEKAEKTCLVVRSINSKVILEPKVIVEEEVLEREKMGNSIPIS